MITIQTIIARIGEIISVHFLLECIWKSVAIMVIISNVLIQNFKAKIFLLIMNNKLFPVR